MPQPRPWEVTVERPWERQEDLYPRCVTVYRLDVAPSGPAGFGAQPYGEPQTSGGAPVWASKPIWKNIQCSIQDSRSTGQHPAEPLSGSMITMPIFQIFIPEWALVESGLLVRDYLLDDLGIKYAVITPNWNSFGFKAICHMLDT